MKNLFLGVCLAPYRVDLYNYLYTNFNCEIFFQLIEMDTQKFNMKSLYDKCLYTPHFLQQKSVFGLKITLHLKDYIRKYNPEFIFVPEFSELAWQIYFIKKLFNFKFKVISVCDDSYDMILGDDFSLKHRIARNIFPYFLDNLLLVDPRVVNWYQSKFKKGIWMPIISDEHIQRTKYQELIPKSNVLNAKFNLQGKKVVLYVGRLVDIKNVKILIEAYAKIRHDARLVIIGNGPCYDSLKKLDAKLETDVIFTGRLEGDELLAWYNVADVFVLPSLKEPFGAVTNEALLAGCYSIISTKAGSSCLIDETNGYIFNPDMVDDLTQKMSKLLDKVNAKPTSIYVKSNLMTVGFKDLINNNLEYLLNK